MSAEDFTPESQDDDAPVAPTPDAEAFGDVAPESLSADGGDADESAPSEAPAPSPDGDVLPVRVREVVVGINPELLCQCPECEPDFVELQWFSAEEKKKQKGTIMLFCQNSSRKYFSPAAEFQAWFEKNPTKPPAKRSRGEAASQS